MKLLVVEDEPVLRSQLVRSLTDENYMVETAEDGEIALYHILNMNYDVVILDVMLPIMDGFAVLKKARENGIKSPILMLTARGDVSDRVQGLDLGADDYLVKPFSLSELKARIRTLVRRLAKSETNKITVGDVELDLEQNRIRKNGEEVQLTGREFSIVEVLIREHGVVIPKSKLYEKAIDEVDDSMSNLLDVHIFNLRKKLGKNFIQNVRGRGYTVS